jgi:hypothetical protein
MTTKNILPVFAVVFSVYLSAELCGQEPPKNNNFKISESLRIIQRGEFIFSPELMPETIFNESFEIHIYGIGDFDVFIAASIINHTIFESVSLPVDFQAVFMPGYGYAQEIDSYDLFVNGYYDYGFNYFDASRRIKEKNHDKILITSFIFAGKDHDRQELHQIFITIFVDQNQNNLIEENEIIHFSLRVRN